MRTIGTKITELTPSSGFGAEQTESDTITWSMVLDWERSRSSLGWARGKCR
jgi:phosphate/sulfate permease